MEELNINQVTNNVELKKVKKVYDYGDKYKGKYDQKKYYNSSYHKQHYLDNKERYKLNGLTRKNKIKEALEMMEKMKTNLI